MLSTVPARLAPMLAASSRPFDDDNCLFELKWDGVRAMAAVNGSVRLWGRDMQDYTGRYPELEERVGRLPSGTMFDGELVVVRNGVADFHALIARHRSRPRRGAEAIRYVVFDMPYLGGRSLVGAPFAERRELLRETIEDDGLLMPAEGVIGAGKAYFEEVIAAGHEGVVAKRLTSPYSPGKRGWKKIKQAIDLPCVVIGYRSGPDGLRDLFMATLRDGELRYVGLVELGIPGSVAFLKQLEAIRRPKCVVRCSARARWVEPKLFCVVRCHGWRPGGAWRDPVFVGWVPGS